MTSLLSFVSDPFARRAGLVSSDRLVVWEWQGGLLGEGYVFPAGGEGIAQFGRYLVESQPAPMYLLTDLVEEEFRLETIPHVGPRDRAAILQRKYQRLFRGAQYCHAEVQGREREGRRDDQVLLSALTNSEPLEPWLERLHAHRVPVAGVYSLALLSRYLLEPLSATRQDALLVSLQSGGGLRQSFFQDGQLKMSRLVRMPRLGAVPFGEYVHGEIEKVRRYLQSLRLLGGERALLGDRPLDVHLLSHGHWLEQLMAEVRDEEGARYHAVDLAALADRLGAGPVSGPCADRLYAHLLLSRRPRNHYAGREHTRYFTLYRQRAALLAASVVLLLGGLGWGAVNALEALSLRADAAAADRKAAYYQARLEAARAQLPATPVAPEAMHEAVALAERLQQARVRPQGLLFPVSQVLLGFPAVQLDSVQWRAGDAGEGEAPPGGARVVELRGHLDPFDGDYRAALAEVARLSRALGALPGVGESTVLEQPLDTRPDAALEGGVGRAEGRSARFALRVVMEAGDGA